MTRTIQTVYELTSHDDASKAIGEVAAKADKTNKATAEGAKKSESAWKSFTGAVSTADHALRLAEKTWRAFESAAKATIGRAIEFRDKNDQQVKSIEHFNTALEATGARIGDKFFPLILGVEDAMTPLLGSFNKWMAVNERLIQSDIIAWTVKLSTGLVRGVTYGVLGVQTAWYGWQLAIEKTEEVSDRAIGRVLEGIAKTAHSLSTMLRAAGAGDRVWDDIATSAIHAAITFHDAGTKHGAEAARIIKDMHAAQEATYGFGKMLEHAIGEAGVKAEKHLGDATARTNLSIAERARLLAEERIAAAHNMTQTKGYIETWGRYQSEKADRLEHDQKVAEGQQIEFGKLVADNTREAYKQMAGYASEAYGIIKGGIADVIAGNKTIAEGAKEVGEALANAVIDESARFAIGMAFETAARKAAALAGIDAAANLAAANAFAAYIGTPVIGAILAPAAAAAAYAETEAWAAKLAFADGGWVRGGVAGRDSVDARLMPDEYVLSVPQVQRAQTTGELPADLRAAPRSSAPSVTIIVEGSRTLALPDSLKERRNMRDRVAPILRGLGRSV